MIVGGILTPLENVLTDILTWFHDTVGLPWAWSIVALTLLVRILLVPVAIRQIHSMQSLQIHAPEMKAIQQRYKSDRQKQSEELIETYKDNKINPYASCLPIVFQIPIFISLYYTLRRFEKDVASLPQYAGDSLSWFGSSTSPSPVKDGGPTPHRRLRREPAPVDVPHVDVDAEQEPALHDHGAADPVPAGLHPAVPVGADDLLADDEPVDDGAGHRHQAPDAEADGSAEAVEPDAPEGGAGGPDDGETTSTGPPATGELGRDSPPREAQARREHGDDRTADASRSRRRARRSARRSGRPCESWSSACRASTARA